MLITVCFLSELMGTMGFPQEEVRKALDGQKYNEVTATYLLLGRKPAEVCYSSSSKVSYSGEQGVVQYRPQSVQGSSPARVS